MIRDYEGKSDTYGFERFITVMETQRVRDSGAPFGVIPDGTVKGCQIQPTIGGP